MSSTAYPLHQWLLPCALNSGKSQRMDLAFKSIPQIKWKRLKSPKNVNSSQTVFALQKGRSRSQTECTHLLSLPPPEGKAIKMNFFSGFGIVSALFQPETSSTSSNSGNFRCEILHRSNGGKTGKKKYFQLKDCISLKFIIHTLFLRFSHILYNTYRLKTVLLILNKKM